MSDETQTGPERPLFRHLVATRPPREGRSALTASAASVASTVSPRLRNREEVARALQRFYPDMLRVAGVGGKVLVWFLIDENGKVRKFQVKQSSGHDALDQAALKVADVMEFTPALNRGQRVPVWVALPVVFTSSAS